MLDKSLRLSAIALAAALALATATVLKSFAATFRQEVHASRRAAPAAPAAAERILRPLTELAGKARAFVDWAIQSGGK